MGRFDHRRNWSQTQWDQQNAIDCLKKLMQRDLDGDHLWIRNNGAECLTARRGSGDAVIVHCEGQWSRHEIEAAKALYHGTDAARR